MILNQHIYPNSERDAFFLQKCETLLILLGFVCEFGREGSGRLGKKRNEQVEEIE